MAEPAPVTGRRATDGCATGRRATDCCAPGRFDDDQLYRGVAEVLGQPRPVPPDTPIAALPVDSFALVELVIDVQERYGVRFGHDDVRALRTVGDLARLVRARLAGDATVDLAGGPAGDGG